MARASTPTLLIGGWKDFFVEQTIEQYHALSEHNPAVALTMGPWTHLDTAVKAAKVIDAEALAWFDRHLGERGGQRSAGVRIHVSGAGEWRDLPSWPPKTADWTVHPNADGRLTEAEGAGLIEFRHDPEDPTPAVGGHHMSPGAGSRDNRKLEERADVVTFTSDPLPGDVEVLGSPRVDLKLHPDAGDRGVFVRICDVDPRGRSWNVSEVFRKVVSEAGTLVVDNSPCAHRFRAGHRIRLQVSGGAFPRDGHSQEPAGYVIECPDSRVHLPVGR